MKAIDASATVGELVARHPEFYRALEKFGIDYCCGGRTPLSQACAERGLALEQVLSELEALAAAGPAAEERWTEAPLKDLADHIEATHHAYLRRELPRLAGMLDRLVTVHGQRHPELAELRGVFASFEAEMWPHMMKEETVLFPLIRALEAGGGETFGSLSCPIQAMEAEHDQASRDLARMRQITGGFSPPADACGTYRAALAGLAELEEDTHRHIHKENSILFPRALALESERSSGRQAGAATGNPSPSC
ncbi:MAG TPA: iron-sulfur cluster repair di-iron protein [Candidatus Nitrosotenuis sp.]|nr:iron-sulfur cluster repair di-iron protein [Candidatus Nitrosotenuis sp.]